VRRSRPEFAMMHGCSGLVMSSLPMRTSTEPSSAAMVGKRSGAVVQQMMHKMLVDLVRDEVKQMMPAGVPTTAAEAVAQFIGGGFFGLLYWWVTGRMRMPVDEVDAAFRRLAVPSLKAAVP
jgi:hypothetical protein